MSILRANSSTAKRSINPRESWPSWTDDHCYELESDGPAPTWDAVRYEPSPVANEFYRGYQLAMDGENPALPAEFPANPDEGPTNRAFLAGLAAGRFALERERERDGIMARWVVDAELDAWVSEREAASDLFDLMSPDEIIEARGHHPSTPYDL
jgi:hypothetical protein